MLAEYIWRVISYLLKFQSSSSHPEEITQTIAFVFGEGQVYGGYEWRLLHYWNEYMQIFFIFAEQGNVSSFHSFRKTFIVRESGWKRESYRSAGEWLGGFGMQGGGLDEWMDATVPLSFLLPTRPDSLTLSPYPSSSYLGSFFILLRYYLHSILLPLCVLPTNFYKFSKMSSLILYSHPLVIDMSYLSPRTLHVFQEKRMTSVWVCTVLER